jgi:excinuclease ABC subunit C
VPDEPVQPDPSPNDPSDPTAKADGGTADPAASRPKLQTSLPFLLPRLPSALLPKWGSESRGARLARLNEKARGLKDVPGVYLMRDSDGAIIYVGKAARLPDRVASYFVPSADLGPKKQGMLDIVHDFDIIECETEWEALLTENRIVKDIKPAPRFNVRLKDDKTFPYLVITGGEDFPRVYVTRNPTDPLARAGKIYGPFASAGSLRDAVTFMQRVFKFRTCSLDIVQDDPKNKVFRPCILAAINQCTAPCAARIDKAAYGGDIDRFKRFLDSKRSVMLREMRQEMQEAAKAMQFEKAAALRDQIQSLERLDERASISDGYQPETEIAYIDPLKGCRSLADTLGLSEPVRCIEAFDIAHLAGGETVASKVCFVDGRPFKDEYRRFKIRTVTNDDFASMREVISRRFREAGQGHELFPDVILIDGGIGQLGAALEAFASLPVQPPMVISLAKKEELIYIQGRSEPVKLSRNNAGLRMCQAIRDEAHRFAQAYHHILRRKKTLGEE